MDWFAALVHTVMEYKQSGHDDCFGSRSFHNTKVKLVCTWTFKSRCILTWRSLSLFIYNQKPRCCVGVVVVCFPFMSTYSNCVLCPQVYASTMHNYVNVMSVNGILEKEPLALVISNNKTVCQYQSLLCSAVWTFLIISNSEKNEQEEGIEAFSESDLSCHCLHCNINTVCSGNQCIN